MHSFLVSCCEQYKNVITDATKEVASQKQMIYTGSTQVEPVLKTTCI